MRPRPQCETPPHRPSCPQARPPSLGRRFRSLIRSFPLRGGLGLNGWVVRPRVLPKPQRHWNRINVESLPPCGFVSGAMELAVMRPADRHDELIAHSAPECARLGEGEVMRVRRYAAAHQARL